MSCCWFSPFLLGPRPVELCPLSCSFGFFLFEVRAFVLVYQLWSRSLQWRPKATCPNLGHWSHGHRPDERLSNFGRVVPRTKSSGCRFLFLWFLVFVFVLCLPVFEYLVASSISEWVFKFREKASAHHDMHECIHLSLWPHTRCLSCPGSGLLIICVLKWSGLGERERERGRRREGSRPSELLSSLPNPCFGCWVKFQRSGRPEEISSRASLPESAL